MSAYDTILAALDAAGVAVKAGHTKARAQCPVHGSHGLTLSVRRFNDRAKVHCFALCDTADVLAAIGLELRDLYDDPKKPSTPYRAPSPLGDVEHFLRRMTSEQALEVSPAYQQRRAQQIEAARRPRPGDFTGKAAG